MIDKTATSVYYRPRKIGRVIYGTPLKTGKTQERFEGSNPSSYSEGLLRQPFFVSEASTSDTSRFQVAELSHQLWQESRIFSANLAMREMQRAKASAIIVKNQRTSFR